MFLLNSDEGFGNHRPGVKKANDHDPALMEFLNTECQMVLEHKDYTERDTCLGRFGRALKSASTRMRAKSERGAGKGADKGVGSKFKGCPTLLPAAFLNQCAGAKASKKPTRVFGRGSLLDQKGIGSIRHPRPSFL